MGDDCLDSTSEMEYDVLILGGGPAGLSAAHELAERKLKVCVLEAAPFIGGKPISALGYPFKPPDPVATDKELQAYLSAPPEQDRTVANKLPMEHGFRVYPENYNNLISLMKRIPTDEGVPVNSRLAKVVTSAPHIAPIEPNKSWRHYILSKLETVFFGLAAHVPFIVCQERAVKYDEISIDELFRLKKRSPELNDVVLQLTDSLSSGMLTKVSSHAVINILMNFYYSSKTAGFQTFDRPTHIAWLKPWEEYLNKLNVKIIKNNKVVHINLAGTEESCREQDIRVKEVIAIEEGKTKIYKAKYIISAIPVHALLELISQNYEILRYDPRLLDLYKIITLPATGVQLYYEKPIAGLEKKLLGGSLVTHPWGISYVDQASYWHNAKNYAGNYGVISIYVSITNQTGRHIQKTLQKCTTNEIAYEMFTEVEKELKQRGITIPKRVGYFAHSYQRETYQALPDDDPVFAYHFNGTPSEDLLHLCIVGMKKWRPLPETMYLGNLLLAGAYTNSETFYVSTMEAASESGRRAANVLLAKFNLPPLTIYQTDVPINIARLRKFDKILYKLWLPNPLEVLVAIMGYWLDTSHVHMDDSIRSYGSLHW